jgi:hypothetical protein
MNEQQSATSVAWLIGQFVLFPIVTLVRSAELLLAMMDGLQRVTKQGLEVMVGPGIRAPGSPEVRAASAAPAQREPAPDARNVHEYSGEGKIKQKEETPLAPIDNFPTGLDKDLHDDMLKLVRYKVLFVRREYEVAFPEREDLVSDNMDGSAFTAWKIAEFIQDLQKGATCVPQKWRDKNYPPKNFIQHDCLNGIPHEDKKYLRVYYEVLERYPREKFKYEEQQIKVLEDIRDSLERRPLNGSGDVSGSGGPEGPEAS